VRLPILVETSKSPPEALPDSELPATPRRRFLVVDDNRDSAQSLATLLHLTGNEAYVAHDGLEAIEAATNLQPEIILLDIGLPKLNGYEVCRRIREQKWGKGMVIVALTGWGHEADRRRSREAGFDNHLVKPIAVSDLKKLLAAPQPAGD
jgi:CheY-like chemotaxis protein